MYSHSAPQRLPTTAYPPPLTVTYLITNQGAHLDTRQAQAVSQGQRHEITSGYSRERHLMLSAPPQIAVQAGGTPIGPDATPRQAFAAAGADFAVSAKPIAFDSAAQQGGSALTPASDSTLTPPDSDWRCVSSHKAIVREDNNRCLGIVGRNYSPVQNEALIRLFDFLREDAQIDNIVTLRHGAKTIVTASLAIEGEVKEGDTIRRYLHAFNSFDGSSGLGVFFSDMRMVCANQISYITGRGARKASKAGEGLLMRHTSGVQQFAERLPQLIDLQNRCFEQDLAELRPLTTMRLTTEAARAILEATFADKLSTPITDKTSNKPRQRTLDDLTEIPLIRSHYGKGTGIGIDTADKSVWNMLQAITQNQTHDLGRGATDLDRARARLESLWGGDSAKRIARAKEVCLSLR